MTDCSMRGDQNALDTKFQMMSTANQGRSITASQIVNLSRER